jgi:hypothetical protein
MMRKVLAFLVVAAGSLGATRVAEAKDLSGRMGVGYVNNVPGTGALSVRYWVNEQIAIQGDVGFLLFTPKKGDASNNYGIGVSGLYSFIDEPNLHIYGTGGFSFGSTSLTTTTATGTVTNSKSVIGLSGGMGMEFFLVGLPNLGLTAGVGLNVVNVADVGTTISVSGADFATFGVRYYFGGPKGPPR